MHGLQSWACGDFDLAEFIGVDEPDFDAQLYNGQSTNANGALASSGTSQFDDPKEDPSIEKMWTTMQYNNMMVDPGNNMFGNTGGFMPDDRYHSANASSNLLNNTVNKLYQQQQHQQQPSTSRLSGAQPQPQPQQTYAASSKMRPQLTSSGQPLAVAAQLAAQHPLGGATDIADSVLLPSSSTSPQNAANALYMTNTQQQPIIKCEPTGQYEMFDSTSDTESHYSHGSRGLTHTPNGINARPRKYRIKPESERLNPQYRMKRAKNNDAVRRSREKAKHQQLEKEKRLQFLEQEHTEHYKTINMLRQRIRELEAINQQQRKNCQCGGANQLFQR